MKVYYFNLVFAIYIYVIIDDTHEKLMKLTNEVRFD